MGEMYIEKKMQEEKVSMDAAEALMQQGQALIWKFMFNFADSMALKSAVELHVADIIHSQGCPITLSQIALGIDSPSPDITCLSRIMRLLVHRKIFTASRLGSEGTTGESETLYGLTPSSMWLLHNAELSLAPMILMENGHSQIAPWHCFSSCVREGGTVAFKKANGHEMWDYASINPDFNKIFNDAMECTARITLKAVVAGYKDGFTCVGSMVDVGGGTGAAMAEIVGVYPHINGTTFDLPHVIETAPERHGVSYVGGDMFESIPKADAVFMKWILHDWTDEECVKILKNCRKAIPRKAGKVIIVDIVLNSEGEGLFDDTGMVFDLVMLAHTSGKERTEPEWKKVLEEGGFPRYNIIKIPALQSIIEAYPE